jgi:hypothetical protein
VRSSHNPNAELLRVRNNNSKKLQSRTRVQRFNAKSYLKNQANRIVTDESDISDFDYDDIIS